MKKRIKILGCIALILSLFGYLWAEQNWIDTEEIVVTVPNLPTAFDGLRIAVVSDIHGKEFGPGNRLLLPEVAKLTPDIIAITGDLIEAEEELTMIAPLATGLSQIAPTYYVTGNHEWAIQCVPQVKAVLADAGVVSLTNEFLTLERDGEAIVLAGIDDPNGPFDQKTPAELRTEIEDEVGNVVTLLLAHRNDNYKIYADAGFDLTFSGHGHGGIIRLPFTDGLLSTKRTFFPSYTNGLYPLDQGQMVVSRGLGNVSISFRLGNRPHLPLVILESDQPS